MSGTHANAYRDGFSVTHGTLEDAIRWEKEREGGDSWMTVRSDKIRFFPIPKDPAQADDVMDAFVLDSAEKPTLEDTMLNSGLLVCMDNSTFYCVRDSALKTIFERAKIKGTALGRLSRENLADVLNRCIAVSRGDALAYLSEGKISAIHGGDRSDYSVLPIPALLEALDTELAHRFPENVFEGSYSDHSMTTALWTLPEQEDDLVGAYRKELAARGITNYHAMVPGIRFTTSNVGTSGANVYPFIKDAATDRTIRFGTAIHIEHKHEKSVDTFVDEISFLYPKFINATKALSRLLDVKLYYPLNAMAEVMKKIGITKKIAFETVETFKAKHGDGPTTAHETYWGIAEALFLMRADGASEAKIASAEDAIARALHINWSEYDIGGEAAAA